MCLLIFRMTLIWKGLPEGLKNRIGIQNTFDKLNKLLKQKKEMQIERGKSIYTQVVAIVYSNKQ